MASRFSFKKLGFARSRPLSVVLLAIATAFAGWRCLCAITKSPTPLVVVTSESMEPTYRRGDVLFVWNRDDTVQLGDVAVCWFKDRELPMVHRVIERVAFPTATAANTRQR